jgi:hypothetical protein
METSKQKFRRLMKESGECLKRSGKIVWPQIQNMVCKAGERSMNNKK